MKKSLATESVANELKGASLFFQPQPASSLAWVPPDTATTPTEAAPRPRVQPTTPWPEEPSRRAPARPPVRRHITRYAFELYQDQVDRLRRIALEEKLAGGKGSMSEMVREAIDRYLVQQQEGTE